MWDECQADPACCGSNPTTVINTIIYHLLSAEVNIVINTRPAPAEEYRLVLPNIKWH